MTFSCRWKIDREKAVHVKKKLHSKLVIGCYLSRWLATYLVKFYSRNKNNIHLIKILLNVSIKETWSWMKKSWMKSMRSWIMLSFICIRDCSNKWVLKVHDVSWFFLRIVPILFLGVQDFKVLLSICRN